MGAARRPPLAPPPDHTAPHAGVYLTQALLLLSRSKLRNFAHLAACPALMLLRRLLYQPQPPGTGQARPGAAPRHHRQRTSARRRARAPRHAAHPTQPDAASSCLARAEARLATRASLPSAIREHMSVLHSWPIAGSSRGAEQQPRPASGVPLSARAGRPAAGRFAIFPRHARPPRESLPHFSARPSIDSGHRRLRWKEARDEGAALEMQLGPRALPRAPDSAGRACLVSVLLPAGAASRCQRAGSSRSAQPAPAWCWGEVEVRCAGDARDTAALWLHADGAAASSTLLPLHHTSALRPLSHGVVFPHSAAHRTQRSAPAATCGASAHAQHGAASARLEPRQHLAASTVFDGAASVAPTHSAARSELLFLFTRFRSRIRDAEGLPDVPRRQPARGTRVPRRKVRCTASRAARSVALATAGRRARRSTWLASRLAGAQTGMAEMHGRSASGSS
jgi:hypothetical protein